MKTLRIATLVFLAGCLPPCLPAGPEADAWLSRAAEAVTARPELTGEDRFRHRLEGDPRMAELMATLPTADLPAVLSGLEQRIAATGSKSASWRLIRLTVLVLTESPGKLAAAAGPDLAVLEAPDGVRRQYGGQAGPITAAFNAWTESGQTLSPDAVLAKFATALMEAQELRDGMPAPLTRKEAARRAGGESALRTMIAVNERINELTRKFRRRTSVLAEKTKDDPAIAAENSKEIQAETRTLMADIEGSLSAEERTLMAKMDVDLALRLFVYSGGKPPRPPKTPNQPRYVPFVEVPDLVGVAGEKKAREVLEAAMGQQVRLEVSRGQQTRRLWKEIVFRNPARLPSPPFDLVETIDDGPLFEALEKAFPRAKADPESLARRQDVSGHYALWLVGQDRVREALTVRAGLKANSKEFGFRGTSISENDVRALVERGKTNALFEFLLAVVETDPKADWSTLASLAAEAGRTDEFVAVARRQAARSDLPAEKHSAAKKRVAIALLAADRIDEAAELLARIVTDDAEPAKSGRRDSETPLLLARVGRLLGNDSWEKAGREAAVAAILANASSEEPYFSAPDEVFDFLIAAGLHAEALRLGEDVLSRRAEWAAKPPAPGERPRSVPKHLMQGILARRVSILVEQGNHAGALSALTKDPRWPASDLAQIMGERSGRSYLAVEVAKALRSTGQPGQARRVLEAFLRRNPGVDSAFALFVELAGGDSLPFLDQLGALHPFEERPLIWKAQTQLTLGRIDDAEQTVQAAIRIDPSDGEQGPPDRMRAYAVLAAIHRRKGDEQKAAFFEGVVRAIRKSERADEFSAVSMYTRAIALYKESLTDFADAYCIQSRVARTLYTQGRMAEAEQYYRRAFELMPDSFGRLESHCFGCEGAFEGAGPQRIAEAVFTAAVAREPQKPQVHYLLGYLRKSQQRYAEARVHLRRAVELDPLYLSAWRSLSAIAQQVQMPPDERDELSLKELQLDPFGNAPELRSIYDHARAWRTLREVIERVRTVETAAGESLLPLAGKPAEQTRERGTLAGLEKSVWSMPLLSAIQNALATAPEE